jgi:hypothetical protein
MKTQKVRNIISFLIIVGIIVAIVYIYKTRIENFESPSTNSVIVSYYFLPSCPHCVNFQTEWVKLQATSDPSLIKVNEVDASDPSNKSIIENEGISGYPTIRILKNGNEYEYGGERTADAITEYIKDL